MTLTQAGQLGHSGQVGQPGVDLDQGHSYYSYPLQHCSINYYTAADVICQFPLNIYLFRAEFLSTDRLLAVTVLVVILRKPGIKTKCYTGIF